jgi:hypothetical protein
MNPVDAVRLMVRSYPGGIDTLAVLVGKSPETLRKEIAGTDPRYKLGVTDACAISEACIAVNSEHCRAFANAIAVNCGGFVQLPVRESGQSVQAGLVQVVKEASDVLQAGTAGMADGFISDNDKRAIEREVTELIEQLQRLQADVAAKHAAGKALRKVA